MDWPGDMRTDRSHSYAPMSPGVTARAGALFCPHARCSDRKAIRRAPDGAAAADGRRLRAAKRQGCVGACHPGCTAVRSAAVLFRDLYPSARGPGTALHRCTLHRIRDDIHSTALPSTRFAGREGLTPFPPPGEGDEGEEGREGGEAGEHRRHFDARGDEGFAIA